MNEQILLFHFKLQNHFKIEVFYLSAQRPFRCLIDYDTINNLILYGCITYELTEAHLLIKVPSFVVY